MIFPPPENLTYVPEVLSYANQVTNGAIGFVFLLIAAFGTFMLTSSYSTKGSIVAAGFITSIVAFFLFIMGLISLGWLFITAIIFILSMIFAVTLKSSNGV